MALYSVRLKISKDDLACNVAIQREKDGKMQRSVGSATSQSRANTSVASSFNFTFVFLYSLAGVAQAV
jgi:hypothetical protein